MKEKLWFQWCGYLYNGLSNNLKTRMHLCILSSMMSSLCSTCAWSSATVLHGKRMKLQLLLCAQHLTLTNWKYKDKSENSTTELKHKGKFGNMIANVIMSRLFTWLHYSSSPVCNLICLTVLYFPESAPLSTFWFLH